MTHDLMRDIVIALGATVQRVVITELRSATYFAEVSLERASERVTVSSRPSDAVALAVRVGCGIYVADDLMDEEAIVLEIYDDEADAMNPDELVGQFRKFLEDLKPEDFGRGS
jgi:bifunctional DNase/RNase